MRRWDVDSLLEEMPDSAFAEWIAYSRLEPFGAWGDDERNAMILAQQAEMHRDKRKRNKPFTSADFRTCHVKQEKKTNRLPLSVLREQMEAVLGKPK